MTTTGRRARYVPRPNRGDQRRAQLLEALEELLAARPLAEIEIADITRACGVTRSAFYFYFTTKAAAVAALLEDFRDQMMQAGSAWYAGRPGTPLERVRATVDGSADLWRAHASLLTAMLDGAAADPEAREIWQGWVDSFVDQVSARIQHERDAGLARAGAEPRALAIVLLGATLSAMEYDVRAITNGQVRVDAVADALVELWHHALYAVP